jgi:mono/diheme cytochrome c family protein
MRPWGRLLGIATAVGLAVLGAVAWSALRGGLSARDEPGGIEKLVARQARHLAVPRAARELRNPLPLTPELLAEARAHFADHCALCHGNDGRGKTQVGQGLYPKSPDMTLPETQSLPDGELFFIIKNGIRLTGMPAWGGDTPEDDRASWKLVHLIRHFPAMTEEETREMEALNPVSPGELKERQDEERFLERGGEPPAPASGGHKH